jgi:dienelactone hydrolase
MRRLRTAALACAAAALLLAVAVLVQYARGAAFVARAAGAHGLVRQLADWRRPAIAESPVTIAWRFGEIRARRYQPARREGRPILLLPGVHPSGIDEPRLIAFARELAASGHPTLTAESEDLTRYSITARTTDLIEDAALWWSREPEAAPDARIGIIGISFAGGLAIVAAGRPALRDRAAFVLSIGGHGDLPRTLRYLSSGIQPDGTYRAPHDYGVAIVLLGTASRVVPSAETGPLREAVLAYLEASRLDLLDKTAAARAFARARELAAALPEPARTLAGYVNARDVAHLGPLLASHAAALGADPALSPDRGAPPACPVFLLHGTDDNVVPALESAWLARTLSDRGVRVRFLATPLLTHAVVEHDVPPSSIWALVRFWSAVLRE